MRRRRVLAAVGTAATLSVAGCLGGDTPEAANEHGYDTERTNGVDVPLSPIDDVIDWYDDEETAFVDTRDRTAFERARIEGAVLSPAPDGQEERDPVAELSTDTRIVTYCVCPHTLATMRGASLIEAGYEHTYALDEGFEPWVQAGYPVEGEATQQRPAVYEIDGRTDPGHAGEYAWARHDATGQREANPIDEDGRFSLHLRFHDVGLDSEIRLATPTGETAGKLASFVGGTVEL